MVRFLGSEFKKNGSAKIQGVWVAELQEDFSSQQISLLRSDHAGEIGAVNIYKGILWCAKDPEIIAFAQCHLKTESKHLASVETILRSEHRSVFSPIWVVAGRALGVLGVLGGKNFLFSTIASVEEFVVDHYIQQYPFFSGGVKELLLEMTEDEDAHREDAANRTSERGFKVWSFIVKKGCGLAVLAALRA